MKNVTKTLRHILTAFMLLWIVFSTQNAHAVSSWGIGASYEIRDSDPGRGFGLRLERGILSGVPLLDFKLRAHLSYFSENVSTYRDVQLPTELDVYDFGIAVTGGIGFGLLHPYAGAGLGREQFEASQPGEEPDGTLGISFDDDSIYWNLYGGVRLPILPAVSPFVEYRFTRLMSAEEFDYNHNSRLAFGVTLSF